jgi:hypothetical protein
MSFLSCFRYILVGGIPVLRFMFSEKEIISVLKFYLMNLERVFQFIYRQHSIGVSYIDRQYSTLFSWDINIDSILLKALFAKGNLLRSSYFLN